MNRSSIGRLPRAQRALTHAVLTICSVSGLLYYLIHDLEWIGTRIYSHPYLVTHGVTASLALMAFGAVFVSHIRIGWLAKRNRASGVAMLAGMTALMITGLLLYYGQEEVRDAAVVVHLLIGGLTFVIFPLHWGLEKFRSR